MIGGCTLILRQYISSKGANSVESHSLLWVEGGSVTCIFTTNDSTSSYDIWTTPQWPRIPADISINNHLFTSIGAGFWSLLTPKTRQLHPLCLNIDSSNTGLKVMAPDILFSPGNRSIIILHTPPRMSLETIYHTLQYKTSKRICMEVVDNVSDQVSDQMDFQFDQKTPTAVGWLAEWYKLKSLLNQITSSPGMIIYQ